MTKIKGEGETKIVKRTRVRVECDFCGEDATKRHTYLLQNARSNPASSAYRRDDCSYCSDADVFTCDDCTPEIPENHSWCSTFSVGGRFDHMFLTWREVDLPADVARIQKVA